VSAEEGDAALQLAVDGFLLLLFGWFNSYACTHCSNPQSSSCQGCSDIVSHLCWCCQTTCSMQLRVYLLAVKVQCCSFANIKSLPR